MEIDRSRSFHFRLDFNWVGSDYYYCWLFYLVDMVLLYFRSHYFEFFFKKNKLGDDLLSHPGYRAVSSALKDFTSGFGMFPGVSPSLWSPSK